MSLKIIVTLSCALMALVVSSCSTSGQAGVKGIRKDEIAYPRVAEVSRGFVQPLAPSRSALPSSDLPKLGRDKHKMPFYHHSQRTRVVRTTAYTHSERDHVSYGPRNAVGTSLKYTSTVRSAAADWSVYPLGTTFRIKGQPYLYVVDDYGSALTGTGTIDIYQPTRQLMKEWGRRYVELTIVRWGDPANSLEVLGSRKGFRHCRQMYAALQYRLSKGLYAKAD
jgi:3D (Asp-Asp-Asp) domain-containing protein